MHCVSFIWSFANRATDYWKRRSSYSENMALLRTSEEEKQTFEQISIEHFYIGIPATAKPLHAYRSSIFNLLISNQHLISLRFYLYFSVEFACELINIQSSHFWWRKITMSIFLFSILNSICLLLYYYLLTSSFKAKVNYSIFRASNRKFEYSVNNVYFLVEVHLHCCTCIVYARNMERNFSQFVKRNSRVIVSNSRNFLAALLALYINENILYFVFDHFRAISIGRATRRRTTGFQYV